MRRHEMWGLLAGVVVFVLFVTSWRTSSAPPLALTSPQEATKVTNAAPPAATVPPTPAVPKIEAKVEVQPSATPAPTKPQPTCEQRIMRYLEDPRDFDALANAFHSGSRSMPSGVLGSARDLCSSTAPYFNGAVYQPREKKPVVYDVVLINTEIAMQLLRMETLYDVVDYFVACETTRSHSNLHNKPLYLQQQLQRLRKFRDKLLPCVLHIDESIGFEGHAIEIESRKGMVAFAANHSRDPDDIIVLSDVDEIPNPYYIRVMRDCNVNISPGAVAHQFRYHADLACYSDSYQGWWGTRMHTVRDIVRRHPQSLHDDRTSFLHLTNAGWHLSYMPLGDPTAMRLKFSSFFHARDNGMEPILKMTDAEWAKSVVEGLFGVYKCTRNEGDLRAPHSAFVNINMFAPYMSPVQVAFSMFLFDALCE